MGSSYCTDGIGRLKSAQLRSSSRVTSAFGRRARKCVSRSMEANNRSHETLGLLKKVFKSHRVSTRKSPRLGTDASEQWCQRTRGLPLVRYITPTSHLTLHGRPLLPRPLCKGRGFITSLRIVMFSSRQSRLKSYHLVRKTHCCVGSYLGSAR